MPGCRLQFEGAFFNELVVNVGAPAAGVLRELAGREILGGVDLGRFYPELSDCILMAATELTTSRDIDALCSALQEVVHVPAGV